MREVVEAELYLGRLASPAPVLPEPAVGQWGRDHPVNPDPQPRVHSDDAAAVLGLGAVDQDGELLRREVGAPDALVLARPDYV